MKPKKKENEMARRSYKWSAERREKFMNTVRNKKNHKQTDNLGEFLDKIWNMLTVEQKREVITNEVMESLRND